MKKQYGDYYLGLDVGTSSVGYAVTDTNYNLMKFKGKQMWGSHLFDSATSAEERRGFRSNRRRRDRQKQRIALLRELFAKEIYKVDVGFYSRLDESRFIESDKQVNQKNTLFFDSNFKDKEYYNLYPTIYHLRYALMNDEENCHDVRLLYLAINHILKHRGHFLLEGENFKTDSAFEDLYNNFKQVFVRELDDLSGEEALENIFYICWNANEEILNLTLRKRMSKTQKKEVLMKVFGVEKSNKQAIEFIKLLTGAKAKLVDLFADEAYKECELKDIELSSSSFEEKETEYAAILGDRIDYIYATKELYDWTVLADILQNENCISKAMIESYNQHQKQLEDFKEILKPFKKEYYAMFHDEKSLINYVAYIGKSKGKDNKSVCSKDDFYKNVKSIFTKLKLDVSYSNVTEIIQLIDQGKFLPKQRTGDNGVIPYQLHKMELERILENAQKHFEFLNIETDGITVAEKVLKIMTFKIPYYVGPLNDAHTKDGKRNGFSWIIRKEEGEIRPWNFEEKVDIEASAEQFIQRMTNTCTYLTGENVIPKDSLLYSKFMVLNELSNLSVDGRRMSAKQKSSLLHGLFEEKKNVKIKDIKNYLIINRLADEGEITGFNGEFKCYLKSYNDFIRIFDRQVILTEEEIEECIKAIVLFGRDKKILRNRINKICNMKCSKEQIQKICNLKYSEWSQLSHKLLKGICITDPNTGEIEAISLISALEKMDYNFMELLSSRFDFMDKINEFNKVMNSEENIFSYNNLVEPLFCSPAVKRGIWRALTIVKEIEHITGHPAKKIFVEMAREDGEKNKQISSRKNQLQELYKNCKEQAREIAKELNDEEESKLRSDKLYLYYLQMGKCMYSGERIELEELFSTNSRYDIDHIFPQSKTKDDSLDNRVLVRKDLNQNVKRDYYPLPKVIKTDKVLHLWKLLKAKGFISDEKYKRLTRVEEFSDEELSGFIQRQLVETRQSTKAIAQTLQSLYSKTTEIVFVKAGNVSEFRYRDKFGFKKHPLGEWNKPKYIKVREVNDYHHAKDAYLNIVVGNVYNTKFTNNPLNYIRNAKNDYEGNKYSLRRMYDYKIERNGVIAWIPGEEGTLKTINETIASNRVQFTRYSYVYDGAFYKQMPLKRGNGQIPLKSDVRFLDFEHYGGYHKATSSYFFLVESLDKKGNKIRTIECLSTLNSKQINDDIIKLTKYCDVELKLRSPRVLLPKIKMQSLFEFDGFFMHITGRSNNNLTFRNATQLILDLELEYYIKKIISFYTKKLKNANLLLSKEDGISIQNNIKLYDLFVEKHSNSLYKNRPGSQLQILIDGRNLFIESDEEKQVEILYHFVELFGCNVGGIDLTGIGGSSYAGKYLKNKMISSAKSVKLINQSPTGLYEEKIDLLDLKL